jgi:hypothetical protein
LYVNCTVPYLTVAFPYLTFLSFFEQVTEAREVLEKALGISETLVAKLNAISQWLVQAAIDIQTSSDVKLLRQKLTEMRDRKHDIREVLAIKQEFVSLCADPSLLVGLKESLTGLESKWSALRDELRRRLPEGETSSSDMMAELDLSGDESYRLTSPATTLNHSISSSSGSGGGEEAVALHEFRAAFQEVSGWLDEAERRLERSEVVESGLAAQLASLRPKMEGLSTMAVCIVERFAAQQADVEPEMEHLEQRWETVSHKIKHSAGGIKVGDSRPATNAGKLAPPPTAADPLSTTSSEEIMTLPEEEDSSRDSSLEFHSANSPSHNSKQISSLEKEGSSVEAGTKSAVTSPATIKSPPPTLPKPRWYMESLQQQQQQPGPPSTMSQEAPPPVQQVIITSATLPSPHILPPQQFRLRKQQTPPAAKRSRSPERTVLQAADSPLTDAPRSVLDDIDRQNARDNEIIDRLLRGTSADIEDVKQARRSYNSVMAPRDGSAGHARDVKDFEEKHTNISVKLALTQSRLHELEKETDAVLRSDLIDMEMRQLEAEVGLLVLKF